MSETGPLAPVITAVGPAPVVPTAGTGTFSEVVCGVLMRISDKGKVTVFRLKPEYEQSVNG